MNFLFLISSLAIVSYSLGAQTGFVYNDYFASDDCTGEITATFAYAAGVCLQSQAAPFKYTFSKSDCSDLFYNEYDYNDTNCTGKVVNSIPLWLRSNCGHISNNGYTSSQDFRCELSNQPVVNFPAVLQTFYADETTQCNTTPLAYSARALNTCLGLSADSNAQFVCDDAKQVIDYTYYEFATTCSATVDPTYIQTREYGCSPRNDPIDDEDDDSTLDDDTFVPGELTSLDPFSAENTNYANANTVDVNFDLIAGHYYQFEVSGSGSGSGSPYLRLVDSNGVELANAGTSLFSTDDDSTNISIFYKYTSPSTQTVTLRQGCIADTACNGTTSYISADTDKLNSLGKFVSCGSFSVTGAEERSKTCSIDVSAGAIITLGASTCSGSLSLSLTDPNNNSITPSNYTSPGDCPSFYHINSSPSTGKWTVEITCEGTEDCSVDEFFASYGVALPIVGPGVQKLGNVKTTCFTPSPPTFAPTFAPTKPVTHSYDMIFALNVDGISYGEYLADTTNNDKALQNSTFTVIPKNSDDVLVLKNYVVKDYPNSRKMRALASSDSIIVTSEYTITTTLFYKDIATGFANNINNGLFNQVLEENAEIYDAASLESATCSSAFVFNGDDNNSNDDDELSDGALIGIIIGGVAGLLIIAGLIFYFFAKKNSKTPNVDNSTTSNPLTH